MQFAWGKSWEKYGDLEVDHPQSTMLYFNTQLVIEKDPGVKEKLYELQRQYPMHGDNADQAYFAL